MQDSQLELALILKNTALPSNPLQKSLAAVFDSLSKELNEKLQQEVRQTLQRPDGPLRYHLRNGLRICELLLPIGVLSWTGYYALQRYMAALNSDTAAFLGFDFLTHSALLTALAWLIPYLARKWLQPSMPKVLRQALLRALTTQLQSTQAQLLDIVQQYQRTANQIGQSAQQLHHSMQTLAQQTHAKISPQPLTNRTLQQAP